MRPDPHAPASTRLLADSLPVQRRHGDDGVSLRIRRRAEGAAALVVRQQGERPRVRGQGREAKLKAAHTPLEEGAAAASSHTPARFQDPAASPSTTRVGATTTTDATGEEHRPRPQPERLGGALSRGTHQHDVSSAAVPSLWDTTAVHARGGRPPRGRCGRRREHATTMEMMALVGRGACAEPCGMWYSRAPVHWLRRDGAVR